MVKRRLTQKQVRTQAKIRAERLSRASVSDQDLKAHTDAGSLGPEQKGLLVAHHGVHLSVEDSDGMLHQCQCRNNLGLLATGDRVIWRSFADGKGVIVAFEARTSLVARPTARLDIRPIASNVSCMCIVVAPYPETSATTLDRYLVLSEWLNISSMLVFNKIDLVDPNTPPFFRDTLELYKQLGYSCFEISTKKKIGMDAFEKALKGETTIFVGQSGVGKSSLISSLLPNESIRIGELSENVLLGKHTTSGSRLYHLPNGGDLIDSPGIRQFGLFHLSQDIILAGFKEFTPYLGTCQFRNCSHKHEPGCALRMAVSEGHIHSKRLENYHELISQSDGPPGK